MSIIRASRGLAPAPRALGLRDSASRPTNLSLVPLSTGLLFLLIQCAGQIPPEGGPPDTIPPTIIRTVPDTNAIRVTDKSIELEFSEYVDRRSVEESIFISPPVGPLEFDWGGTDVTITFQDTLRGNTTYVVNVGTDVVDRRAKNRMASGFSLAFSTGDSIDRGMVSGKVFDAKPEGVMIFAYLLNAIDTDTLDPGHRKPDYIMQTGKNGAFTLSNLAWGRYRLFAVRDEYRNLVYDKQVDQYGVAQGEIALSVDRERVNPIWFHMAREDTSRPFLTSVEPLDSRHIRIRFSEPIDSLSFTQALFQLCDTLTATPRDIALRYQSTTSGDLTGIVTSALLDSGVAYLFSVEGISDTAGNLIDPQHAGLIFTGSAVRDTVRPVIRIPAIAPSAMAYEFGRVIELDFSEPVDPAPISDAVVLMGGSGKVIGSRSHMSSPVRLLLESLDTLLTVDSMMLRVVLDSIRDLSGNTYTDSVLNARIPLLDLQKIGELEGSVNRGDGSKPGTIYVTAANIKEPWQRRVRLREPGSFRIDRIPEGLYVLSAFLDADSSANYSPGLPFPFRPSEPFVVGSDTIKVRARWGVEGVVLTLP